MKEVHLKGKEQLNKETQAKWPLKSPILFVDIYFQEVYPKTCIMHGGSKRYIMLDVTHLASRLSCGKKNSDFRTVTFHQCVTLSD